MQTNSHHIRVVQLCLQPVAATSGHMVTSTFETTVTLCVCVLVLEVTVVPIPTVASQLHIQTAEISILIL